MDPVIGRPPRRLTSDTPRMLARRFTRLCCTVKAPRLWGGSSWNGNAQGLQCFRIAEPRMHAADRLERADHQAGTDEQNQRQGYLNHG